MPNVHVNGIELFYKEEGTGKPILLLHGLTGSHLMLQKEFDTFKKDYRVITMDARGHGKSEKPETYTLEDHIQDCIALMDHLALDKVMIIGMSMGTYVGQGVAIEAPDRVEKLILVSGAAHGDTSDGTGLLAKHADDMIGMSFEEQMGHLAHHIFHKMEPVGKWLSAMPSGLTKEQQESAADALAKYDFRPKLHTVTAETLVISGKYDGLNPPESGEEIASHITGAHFVLFEESGHAPNIEETEEYFQLVTDFLKE